MPALDMTSFAGALKEHYAGQTVQNMVYKNNPLLALVPKYEKFGGKNYPLPLIYGNPTGRSATFSNAQANKNGSKIVEFLLTRNSDYALASLTNEVLEASMGNANAFMEAATCEIDGAINAAARSLAIGMYGTGSGTIGQVASGMATTVITLTNANDVTNFEVGMVLKAATTEAATSLRAGSVTVTGVDRDAGTLTAAAAWTAGIAALVANDYLVVDGDATNKIKGLSAWIPFTAPTSTAFFGVDRSVDTSRLAGIRQDGSAKPIEEALIDLAVRIGREGGSPDYCFMDFSQYANLEKALGSKVQYVDVPAGGTIGFKALQIQGPRGTIKVIPDQNCSNSYAWMLQLDSWKLYSLGGAPKILDSDGMKMLRESSADAVEIRVGYYAQLGCAAPGFNGIVKLV
jgi:hypothetical protein